MNTILRPTLARRIVLSLLIAFGLVWITLMARQFYTATDQQAFDSNLQALGDSLFASISSVESDGEARAIAASTSTLVNDSYRNNRVQGALLIGLSNADGERLFISPEGGQAKLKGMPGMVGGATIGGQRFRVYLRQDKRWSLTVAAPQQDSWWILSRMGGELTVDMLIAFPFVLLPVWLAVRSGLRPLHKLSDMIAKRGDDNLSPLGYEAKHAELQPLANALDSLISRLRMKLKREHGFVQDAAHELRTPMAVISAQAHVLSMATTPEQRTEAEQRMNHAIARASHLVGQLLDLAQIGNHRDGKAGSIDAAHLLRQELAALVPAAAARDIELSLEAPDTLQTEVEVHAFQSIVHNLVANALAYIHRDGQVSVELKDRNGEITLSVTDDGPGIAPDLRELVFERFYRGKAHDVPGAGLGLAIVREAATRLRGAVSLSEGMGGKGCRFVVTIPAAPSPA
ncbi:sensor histidine kinase [Pseudoduganella violaceinigra]|uniref:sensor histidine kinase n=1 Tax=Pseudoduganella violaceinigra TaxID=246602 RepID=UPI0004254D7E|nr:HAMP domain-containing sensor histidine kinase [Pseudoduganella violaceinigra]